MTGDEVKALRQALGLKSKAFADLCGTSGTTMWRWETCGSDPAPISGHSERILLLLVRQVQRRGSGELGLTLRLALAVSPLQALYELLGLELRRA
jgi:transcriptional regulator with XRE-family HTH domain